MAADYRFFWVDAFTTEPLRYAGTTVMEALSSVASIGTLAGSTLTSFA